MKELKVHAKQAKSFKSWLLHRTKACSSLLFAGGPSLFKVLSIVNGYLYPHEAAFLYRMARYAPGDEPIVEIGSMQGLSTLCFAMGLKKRNQVTKIIAVDPHLYGTEMMLRHNLSQFQVQKFVNVIVSSSEEVARKWQGLCRLIFIDGAHDILSALRDFHEWLPYIRPGGYLLLHDSTSLSGFPGPIFVAKTKIKVGKDFDEIGTIGSITWGRKKGGDSLWKPSLPGARMFDFLLGAMKRKTSVARKNSA